MLRRTVNITTAADGTATAYTQGSVAGELHSIHYIKDTASAGANAFADGVDFTITDEKTGETLWAEANVNASAVRYPRAATHSNAGVAALYAAGGTAVMARPGLANTRIKIVIAQGGNAKVGRFEFVIAD